MSNYKVDIQTNSGNVQTLYPDIGFSYTKKLNEVNEGKFNYSTSTPLLRTWIQIGGNILVYKNGTIDYAGKIVGTSKLEGGGISVRTQGIEILMGNDSGSYPNSPYISTNSATIAGEIISESPLSAGTIDSGGEIDFRIKESTTFQSALENLRKKTAQDLWYDYSNFPTVEVNLVNHQGSQTSKYTFNDGTDINNLDFSNSKPKGNKILVYGKGDGENQIKSEYPSHGYDSTSQSEYGTILYVERDPTIISINEANALADSLVAAYKNPMKYYFFEVNNPDINVTEGDVITLNSPEKDLNAEEVRIVGIQRNITPKSQILSLQVTNKENSELLTKRDKLLGKIQSNASNSQTYMQGTTNVLTFSEMINANSEAPLRVKSYLPEDFIKDEVGNLRINSFTLDYDVDPFRSGVGSATQEDRAPSVAGVSGSTSPGVSGGSGNTQPGVNGISGTFYTFDSVGSDSISTITCNSGYWTQVATVYPGSAHIGEDLLADLYVYGNSGGSEDIEIAIRNYGVYGYIEPGLVGSGAAVFSVHQNSFRDSSMCVMTRIPVGIIQSSSQNIGVFIKPQSGDITLDCGLYLYTAKHSHNDGSYYASSHYHDDGSYNTNSHGHTDGSFYAGSHNHNVQIGDGISDSGSTNATGVNIYLDYWNGSSWVNKHSILNTGKTIDYDVDLSNGGQYPDDSGFWRARIYSNSTNPDLIQGIIKCKHELDS